LAAPERSPARKGDTVPPSAVRENLVVLTAQVGRAEAAGLCERACSCLAESGVGPLVCDVGALTDPDAGTLDVLARLALTASRRARRVRLRGACGELEELVELAGLVEVLPAEERLRLEPGGQPEHREEPRSVQEERDPRDPPVQDLEDLQ
jgi:STAS domain-containing protein